MSRLAPKREAFCEEYLIDLNATQAAIRAGYSEKSAEVEGSRLLSNAKVKARVSELMAERSERVAITADYVLGSLKEVAERCMQRAPVMVRRGRQLVQATDADGKHIWKFDSMGANTALGLLGKHLKLFTDKVEHSGKLTLEDILDQSYKVDGD